MGKSKAKPAAEAAKTPAYTRSDLEALKANFTPFLNEVDLLDTAYADNAMAKLIKEHGMTVVDAEGYRNLEDPEKTKAQRKGDGWYHATFMKMHAQHRDSLKMAVKALANRVRRELAEITDAVERG